MPEMTNPVSLRDFIDWVKQELLSEEARKKDPVPLFAIDEVTVEVSFVVDTNIKAGASFFKVVEFGSEIGGQAVQKATIKMTPIVKHEELVDELVASRPEIIEMMKSNSVKAILKGRVHDEEAPR